MTSSPVLLSGFSTELQRCTSNPCRKSFHGGGANPPSPPQTTLLLVLCGRCFPERIFFFLSRVFLQRYWTQIEYYGGYENVARRLHLGYHYEDELRYQEKVRDELRVQNEMYGKVRERNLEKQRNKLAKLKVRLHVKRMNYEREMKLADGLRQQRAGEEEDSGLGRRR